MADSALPTPLHDFICDRIRSIEELEVLLLVKESPQTTFCARALACALNITEALAEAALQRLASEGLMVVEGRSSQVYRYAPPRAELAQAVELLASLYPRAKVDIVMLVSHCAMERIRAVHVRAFAQAFLARSIREPVR